MKEGWTYKSLGDCIDKVPKQKQVKSKDYQSTGRYPIVSQERDLISGYWDDESFLYKHERPVIIFGDHTKEIKFIDFDFVVGADGTQILSPKDCLNAKFFYYALLATPIRSLGYARHFKLLKEKSFPIPPLSEQERIVEQLDAAFAQIDELKKNAEKQLAEARALFQSALTQAMQPKPGWEQTEFGNVCYYHKEQAIHYDRKYIGMEHIESGTGVLLGFQDSNEIASSSFGFSKGDVLYGRLRPYLRKIIIAEFDGCCSTEIFPIRSNHVEPEFIKYWFLTDEITNKINATSAGCRMPRGNMNEVKSFSFHYPKEKSEQRHITNNLDIISSSILKLERICNKTIAECDALKQALLRQIFE